MNVSGVYGTNVQTNILLNVKEMFTFGIHVKLTANNRI